MLRFGLISVLSNAAPPKPTIPLRFYAEATFLTSPGYIGNGTVALWTETDKKLSRHEQLTHPYNVAAVLNTTTIATANEGISLWYDACHPGSKFFDLFGWTDSILTTYEGTVIINGTKYDEWRFGFGIGSLTMITDGNRPVVLKTSILTKSLVDPTANATLMNTTFQFTRFLPLPSNQSFPSWIFEATCTELVCPLGPVVNYDAYRFHDPTFDHVLANQDVGDLVGDVFFVCTEGDDTPQYQWISRWTLSVNSTWGQYAVCNGNPPFCVWGSSTLVGRETPLALDPRHAGQCVRNEQLGEWLSLPAKTQCTGTQKVGDQGCTWKEVAKLKTINSTCLFNTHKFSDACHKDGGPPYATAAAVFKRAFEETDITKGGCPAI